MAQGIWTGAQQKKLEELAALRLPARLIGVAVGKTRDAVIGRAHRTGVKLRDNPTRGTSDVYPCGHERTSENTKVIRYLSGPSAGKKLKRCLFCYVAKSRITAQQRGSAGRR
jgi:hypothetical protein